MTAYFFTFSTNPPPEWLFMTDDTTPIDPDEDKPVEPEPIPGEDPPEPEYEPKTDPVTPDA